MLKRYMRAILIGVVALATLSTQANELNAVNFNVLPGERVELRLTMSTPPATPKEFTIENPSRIVMTFPDTQVKLADKSLPVSVGVTRSLTAVEAQGQTRVVINLVESTQYVTRIDGNDFVITVGQTNSSVSEENQIASEIKPESTDGGESPIISSTSTVTNSHSSSYSSIGKGVQGIDFRRGEDGEGRVIIKLSEPSIGIDLRQEGHDVVADFVDSNIDDSLIRKLDVVDFATPAKIIETKRVGGNIRLTIQAENEYEFLAYQTDDVYTIELKPLTAEEVERRRIEKPQYTGDRMSLTFQDISVRAVLQLISDFNNLNMVTSDTVAGSITLRLQNVPWDQALDIILKTKGLDKRQNGNVLLIAPAEEIAAREALELQSERQVEQLAQIRSEYIQVNYAKAATLSEIIAGDKTSFLSERGSINIDERTNTLLVRDTAKKLDEIRQLVRTLDVPVRQVLIESRIVVATDGVSEEIGVRLGVNDLTGEDTISGSLAISRLYQGLLTQEADEIPYDELYGVPLPVSNPNAAHMGFTIGSLSDEMILDLELSALESENKSEVIASPKVVTANQKEAYIEAGEEIPYYVSSVGSTKISFKKAVLSLKVTPQITPDDRVILDLQVNQDTRGDTVDLGTSGGQVPAIRTREVTTQVLVDNGETVVLGGIYEQETNKDVSKVPLLGDIPGIGFLFRRTRESEAKRELLIFVTPKIIKEGVR